MEYNSNSNNVAMGWDDVIEEDSGGSLFIVLEEGDYNFTVTNFERGYFDGSAKVAPCPKAIVSVEVNTEQGPATSRINLLLNKQLEWKLSDFLRCIGQKKRGEKVHVRWDKIIGAKGRAHFKPREYTGNNGKTYHSNDIDRFYDYDEKYFQNESPSGFRNLNDDEEIPF